MDGLESGAIVERVKKCL